MSKAEHGQFAALAHILKTEIDEDTAEPFVPVAPAPDSALPRILFVGQATRSWSDHALADYDHCWHRSAQIVAEFSFRRNGGFWQVVDDITRGVFQKLETELPSAGLQAVAGWSNLAKIGNSNKNPNKSSLEHQSQLCVDQFRLEIERMDPTAVVLLTRNFAENEILKPALGADGWTHDTPSEDRVAYKDFQGRPVIWANHPRNMGPAGYRRETVALAIDLIVQARR